MTEKSYDLITEDIADWRPSAEAQMVIFWRMLHLFTARYGSIPLGQLLVGLTTITLNELGRPPTVGELCAATGLPKSSISRYIAAQMELGVVTEEIDPQDRRRRKLMPTDEGRTERQWQIQQMRKILQEICAWDRKHAESGVAIDPDAELEAMAAVNQRAPKPYDHRRRSRGKKVA